MIPVHQFLMIALELGEFFRRADTGFGRCYP